MNIAEKLIEEVFLDIEQFNKEKKGYSLLNEYLKGFSVETLVPLLKSVDKEPIYQLGISIASELNDQQCLFLLPYLIPLLEKEKNKTYRYYILQSIFSGTFIGKYKYFYFIVRELSSSNQELRLSAMRFLIRANELQIKYSIDPSSNFPINEIKKKGLDIILNPEHYDDLEEILLNEDSKYQIYSFISFLRRGENNSNMAKLIENLTNRDIKIFYEREIRGNGVN